jgi:hypothetical protein
VIGGQALNLWAEYYSAADELAQYRPYTSKDIDYFGYRDAAQKLADALGGHVLEPTMDDQTPQTAIVEAEVQGQLLRIDFLGNVLGVRPKALQANVVEIIVPYTKDDVAGHLAIPVMHPLHCLQSRIANLVVLRRPDATARRQAEAAPVVLRQYLAQALRDGDHREATRTLQGLFDFLARDTTGRKAHRVVDRDPLEVMKAFVDDPRIDARYREKILQPAIERIRKQRTAIGRMLTALGRIPPYSI